MSTKAQRLFSMIAALSVVGASISAISLYHHFGHQESSFCNFGHSFNCDMVNRSIYSTVAGIPVALIGLLGYLAIVVLTTLFRHQLDTPKFLLSASFAGFAFALYLTYLEAFVLGVWCVLCLSSLAVMTIVTILSALLIRESRRIQLP